MGHDLYWYIIPKDLKHEKTLVCIDLDHEPDELGEDTCFCRLYEAFKPDNPNHDNYAEFRKEVNKIRSKIYNLEKEFCNRLCPLCRMYINGIYWSGMHVDGYEVGHSYSNPVWDSDWNIMHLMAYVGDCSSDFARRWQNTNVTVKELFASDVEECFARVKELGEPKGEIDKEAREETMRVLEFLREWAKDDAVHIMYVDEL